MDLNTAINTLNATLKEKNPSEFSSSWIYRNHPGVYRFILKNMRTELGTIDWDGVTRKIDKQFQARWFPRKVPLAEQYSDPQEVHEVLKPYWDKRYVFIQAPTDDDKELCNTISIALVRLAQKGNLQAEDELLELLQYTVEEWVDRFPRFWRWKFYTSEIKEKCKHCIYRYRYTGSFIGYLYKTLECSAMALPRPQELDATILDGGRRRIDSVIQDDKTGEIRIPKHNEY
ncbi:hypothetical protein H6770_05620 [Candidatus Peribacteria bacterium]|nr:hypothetical protein [Candidatus Peribacteria bacterium]